MLRFTCFALLVSLALGLELKAQIKDHWKSFKASHKKVYSASEENVRKEIFKNRVEGILKHNLDSDLGESTHQLGLNEFSDMSHEEFVNKMLGLNPDLANKTAKARRYSTTLKRVDDIPKTVDYRDQKAVTPVKNQGECGSCWSFATTGALEGHYALKTGKLVTLSEQNLVDCSKIGNNGCDGGLMDNAFEYIISNGGIDLDSCYPYETKQRYCRFKFSCIGATMSDYEDVPFGDEYSLLDAVATKGPVAVGIDAGQDDFQDYRSGVYNPSYCSKRANHAVLVIGYGTENGTPYWLVKNSWGTTWGIAGYFKLIRHAGSKCGVANMASYPIV